MNRLPSSHRSQRGAALLMVTVVITLLTIVGAFAARSTGRVTRAAGEARRSTATRNMAEHGIRTAAARVAIKSPFSARERGEDKGNDTICGSTAFQRTHIARADDTLERCAMVESDTIAKAWQVPMVEDVDASNQPLLRKFVVEITDETDWGADVGEDAGSPRQSKRATVHVRSVVGPWTTDLDCGSSASLQTSGQTSSYGAIGTIVYRAQ